MWDIMIKQSAKVYNTSQAAAHQLWTKSEQYTMVAAYKNKNTRNGTAYSGPWNFEKQVCWLRISVNEDLFQQNQISPNPWFFARYRVVCDSERDL